VNETRVRSETMTRQSRDRRRVGGRNYSVHVKRRRVPVKIARAFLLGQVQSALKPRAAKRSSSRILNRRGCAARVSFMSPTSRSSPARGDERSVVMPLLKRPSRMRWSTFEQIPAEGNVLKRYIAQSDIMPYLFCHFPRQYAPCTSGAAGTFRSSRP